ncbi:MAG: hypothetical protein ABSH20_08025 [Tepidisphaeraceae bacterium]|jgi:hypothetical protein
MASRIIVRIELTAPAKKAVETLTEKNGMTQVAMLSRLVEWFARQPDAVQTAAMSLDPEAIKATSNLIVKQMASGK